MLRLSEEDENLSCYEGASRPYGLTYGVWTVKWWQWALSFPRGRNPVTDDNGKFADSKQPPNVFFLAGKFGSRDKMFPKRHCVMTFGKSILIPIINYEANMLEYPELITQQDVLNDVTKHMDSIIIKECLINDKRIEPERVHSDPKIFPLSVNEDIEGSDRGKHVLAAADGYWVFVRPLCRGEYNISFKGSCEEGRLNSGADYQVFVI
jgi:hypothetical protein